MKIRFVNLNFACFCPKKAFLPCSKENRKPENDLNKRKKAQNSFSNRKPEICEKLREKSRPHLFGSRLKPVSPLDRTIPIPLAVHLMYLLNQSALAPEEAS
jgi:hypothetical protein